MPVTVTHTIRSSGGDYTSLAAWESAQQRNLVTADEIAVAECHAMVDAAANVIDGWTTDATRFIHVRAAAGAEARMPWSTSSYRISAGHGVVALTISALHVRVTGIAFEHTGARWANGGGIHIVSVAHDGEYIFERCFGRNAESGGQQTAGAFGISFGNVEFRKTATARNCVMVGFAMGFASGWHAAEAVCHFRWLNCTSHGGAATDGGIGFRTDMAGGTKRTENCLATHHYSAAFFNSDGTRLNNASHDATATGTGARINQTFTFVDAASGDYHLAASDAGARTFGADLSADFTDDFDGIARSVPWDIGADEFVDATLPTVRLGVFDPDLVPLAWFDESTVRLGVFDPDLVPLAWFDESAVAEGWYADELIGGALSQALTGAVTMAGTLVRSVIRGLTGATAPSATLAKQASRALTGAATPTGALAKRGGKPLTATVTPAGTVVRDGRKPLAGSVASTGVVAKQASRAVTGATTPTGALARQPNRALTGAITPSGALAAGKLAIRSLAGQIAASGALTGIKLAVLAVAGSLTPAGTLARRSLRALAGTITPSGAVAKRLARALAGATTPTGDVAKRTARSLAGSVAPTGVISGIKIAVLAIAGALTPTGTVAKRAARSLAGTVTPSGAVAKRSARALSGTTTPTATIARLTFRVMGGTIASTGLVTRRIGQRLAGVLAAVGTLIQTMVLILIVRPRARDASGPLVLAVDRSCPLADTRDESAPLVIAELPPTEDPYP